MVEVGGLYRGRKSYVSEERSGKGEGSYFIPDARRESKGKERLKA